MRVVPDLNLLVSSLLARGNPAKVIDQWLEGAEIQFVVCPTILDKLSEVLDRPKFTGKIAFVDRLYLSATLRSRAEVRPDPARIDPVCRDPDDDILIALALEAVADGIVSGDTDLTELQTDVKVWTPKQLLDILDGAESSD